ncbi:hypothetical protein [Nocardia sp. NPDC052566]|uniref:hypothetical protein n=1 Tax=Nocardia sp. NPDC052566 TaxID=3364330 RepID=UPI0037C8A83E
MPPRHPLAKLSDADLVRAVLYEINQRESFAAVRTELSALLAAGPTLTAALEAGTGDLVDRAIKRAAKVIEVQNAILEQPLLTSSQVSKALGTPGTSHRSTASRLRAGGGLIGLNIQSRYLFPAFQFDFEHARVFDVVTEVNRHLDAVGDPWRAAAWWMTEQHAVRPVELIGRDDRRLRDLAGISSPNG